jgi:uncharacterized protein (DUF849 family)
MNDDVFTTCAVTGARDTSGRSEPRGEHPAAQSTSRIARARRSVSK